MVFSSLTFLTLFLPILLILYFMTRNTVIRNGVLLVGSLLFYGWSEPVFIVLMVLSTLLNYFCALSIHAARRVSARRVFLIIGVLASIAGLVYFKYCAFLINSFTSLFGFVYRMDAPALPVGISFYTFQILTYTVDVYRKKVPVQKNPFRLMLYVSCFPQLIAGPIVQYSDVADSLGRREISPIDFTDGMRRFIVGLSKKVLLANLCGAALEKTALAGTGAPLTVVGAWLSAILYAMQLYFDFSAYSDMAIGMGRMFGFRYKENFDYPYISKNITDFWRRWHISLGAFFRDYVYIPLGGNRAGWYKQIRNMLLVWTLTGLWHGASWNFLIWGLYYGVLLIIEKYPLRLFHKYCPAAIDRVITLALVLVGWVLFYYTNLADGVTHILAMFGYAREAGAFMRVEWIDETVLSVLREYTLFPVIAAACCLPIVPGLKKQLSRTKGGRRFMDLSANVLLSGLLVLSVLFLIGQSYNPFIYFRF